MLTPDEWQLWADAAFWSCRTDSELGCRRRAFAGFVDSGEPLRAAYTAWLLAVRLGLRGDQLGASGWLQRAHRHANGRAESVEHGYVACGQAEREVLDGRPAAGQEHAARAVAIGQRFGDGELVALGLAWLGMCEYTAGDPERGARCLDEAMVSVTGGELEDFFTGWIYCFVTGVCIGVADLKRADTWTRQAWAWASALPRPTPYLAICRIRQVELLCLRGELLEAEGEVERLVGCHERLGVEPNLAGEAYYLQGEVLRRRGDLSGAEAAFDRARGLGLDPQPGHALVLLARGRAGEAASTLRAAEAGGPPLRQGALLSARVEVAVADRDLSGAEAACAALTELAGAVDNEAMEAMAATCRGQVLLARSEAESALSELRLATTSWRSLGLASELARACTLVGLAMRQLGDEEGARHEFRWAKQTFERRGALPEAARVVALLDERGWARSSPRLTDRECEVLAHVADGSTNLQIAEALSLSQHTVARHLSNIFTKLGVSSRTAAAAHAWAHGIARAGTGPVPAMVDPDHVASAADGPSGR